jgi:hypothetical protein
VTSGIYQKLRDQLNLYSVGYPNTKSGVEIRILEKLFTEEEAQTFLRLDPIPSTDAAIASQSGDSPSRIRTVLDRMYERWLPQKACAETEMPGALQRETARTCESPAHPSGPEIAGSASRNDRRTRYSFGSSWGCSFSGKDLIPSDCVAFPSLNSLKNGI